MAAINSIGNYCPISKKDFNIIKQAQKPIQFNEGSLWTNRSNPDLSITMGLFDSEEAFGLIAILLL